MGVALRLLNQSHLFMRTKHKMSISVDFILVFLSLIRPCLLLTTSPVHYIRLSTPPKYRLQCSQGRCKYISMFNQNDHEQSVRDKESLRKKEGRRIIPSPQVFLLSPRRRNTSFINRRCSKLF